MLQRTLALCVVLAAASALCTATTTAQSAPPAVQPALTMEQRVEQLSRELEAQREALAAQKAEQEAQRVAAEREKAELKARLEKVEADAQAAQAQAALAQTESELAQLAEGEEVDLAADPLVSVYGFADVGLQRSWGPIAALVPGGTTKTTFVLGNVNLYFDARPITDWRFLSEVRFGLFPNGSTGRASTTAAPLINTTISDDASPSGGFTQVAWNGVILERAHVDWEPSDAFNLRTGLFLTPIGIYNVDHGSPTRIMLEAPLFITSELMPSRQVGIEAFGHFNALPWTLGYHLYVSNGRQPGQLDYADDKAIGTRLWAQTRRPFPMTFGASAYTGRYELVQKTVSLNADGSLDVGEDESVAYREHAVAADVSADIGDLRLRTELLAHWRIFMDGKRSSYVPGSFDADTMWLGTYFMAAYRLPWLGLEPVAQADLLRIALPLGEYFGRITAGINIYFDPAVILRLAYIHTRAFDLEGPERELQYEYFNSVAARLSIAF